MAVVVLTALGFSGVTWAYALNGPWYYKATVPWYGPWQSAGETASGYVEAAHVSSMTSQVNGDAYAQINCPKGISSPRTISSGSTVVWDNYGLVSKGQGVELQIRGDWYVTVTFHVSGYWDS